MHTTRPHEGFVVEDYRLSAPSLPGKPLTVAHLSDLHLRATDQRLERMAAVVNERAPDLVAVTGDFITYHPRSRDTLRRLLRRLQPRKGIFACRGNWELQYGPRPAVLKEMLAAAGAELLVNESRLLEIEGSRVRVAGVDDPGKGWPDFAETLSGQPGDYTILLAHAPLAAEFIGRHGGVDLMLSGHTHGGQVRIPLLWRALLPDFRAGMVAGLYRRPWGHVYVSRGFGGVGIGPIRFRCPAEVAFLQIGP
ncbi:MAG: metallophosphoesterase [Candidatus Brocadiia bacterium]